MPSLNNQSCNVLNLNSMYVHGVNQAESCHKLSGTYDDRVRKVFKACMHAHKSAATAKQHCSGGFDKLERALRERTVWQHLCLVSFEQD